MSETKRAYENGTIIKFPSKKIKDRLKSVPAEIDCSECGGSGDLIDESKIHSCIIDVPYKKCPKCWGKGTIENES